MKKKIINLSSLGVLSVGLIATGVAGYASNSTNEDDVVDEIKPLNRGKNFEHFSLKNYFNSEEFKKTIVLSIARDEKYSHVFDKGKFIDAVKDYSKKVLKSIDRFKGKWDQYEFVVSYAVEEKNIMFDLVWSLPNAKYFFYDQLKMLII